MEIANIGHLSLTAMITAHASIVTRICRSALTARSVLGVSVLIKRWRLMPTNPLLIICLFTGGAFLLTIVVWAVLELAEWLWYRGKR